MSVGEPRRLTVGGYVAVGFSVAILALGLVLVTTTTTSFRRERVKAVAELRVAAQYTADSEQSSIPQTAQSLNGVAGDPAIESFDPQRCAATMAGFAGFASQAGVFVIDPAGHLVCSLGDSYALPAGDWVSRTRAEATTVVTDTLLDPKSTRPTTVYAMPIPPGSTDGGALVVLWDSATRSLPVPANMSHGVSVFELDKTRSLITSASANSPHKPGVVPAKSWLRTPLGDATSRIDADGIERIYQEVRIDSTGTWVLAAIPKSVAMVESREELRNNLIVGAAVVLLVIVLGSLMQRRIARPIKTLKDVIVASAADHVVNAVPEGPAEVAAVASAFNTTMRERRQLEGDLADALKHAQRASQLKSEFLANMSHEIRTPMNGVLGMLSLLEDAEVTPDVRDCLVTMSDSAASLMAILNELLDFSKLEAGMMSAERCEFSVREVVRGAVSPWVGIAGRKNVPLVATVDNELPDELIGDPTRVRQILSNLIDNAVKFTNHGRITVTATKQPGDFVRFAVADSGIGITEESRAHLFEPFVQADGTTTRRFGGTGLGLAICKQLAEFMGGRIGVESVFGEGSTFWFELPLPVAHGLADETTLGDDNAAAPATIEDAAGLRVLVVDDNLVNQKVAVQMLRKLGYDVSVAGDGVAALRAIDANVFDVVLMDVQMPVMDGWEATSELRRRGSTIPIVAMTASALEEDRKRCAAVGMDGYVVKPMNLDALNSEILRVLAHLADAASAVSA